MTNLHLIGKFHTISLKTAFATAQNDSLYSHV